MLLRIHAHLSPNVVKEPNVCEGHSEAISYLSTVKDPNLVVTAGSEKNVRVWDVRTKETVKTLVRVLL